MRIAIYQEYGGPGVLELRETERPIPLPNQILIRVHASTVTPLDWKFRSGRIFMARLMSGIFKPRNPVLGTEFSGRVLKAGKDIKTIADGDEVYAAVKGGAYAEYVCLTEKLVFKKPVTMTLKQAATVPNGALTAYHFLKRVARIKEGQRVLINGASGGVGIFAVQIAQYLGAHVTGVCSSENVRMVDALGADRVIDYKTEDFTQSGDKYDVIFDVAGKRSFKNCKNNLNPKGIYLTTVLNFENLAAMMRTRFLPGRKARFSVLKPPPNPDLNIITELIEAGHIRTVIGETFTLRNISAAHRFAQQEHPGGKIIVLIEDV